MSGWIHMPIDHDYRVIRRQVCPVWACTECYVEWDTITDHSDPSELCAAKEHPTS